MDQAEEPEKKESLLDRLVIAFDRLLSERLVSASSVVVFRMCFGLIMAWECKRFLTKDWIERYYQQPEFFFTYYGFDWVRPLPGDWMFVHFWVLGGLAILIFLGLFYRVAAWLFFFGFTYVFLLDKTNYLNHFYLISLVSFLMAILPLNRYFSLDALIWPRLKSEVVPLWTVNILRFIIGVPYFFGGIAKINPDWLRGEPMRSWMQDASFPGFFAGIGTSEFMAYFMSYGGLLFDLLIVPFLIWRKTRIFAYMIAVCFHLTNVYLFHIGIFPWMMIAVTTIFFAPEWANSLFTKVKKIIPKKSVLATASSPKPFLKSKRLHGFLVLFIILNILIPLRHWAIPGTVHWNEQGHRFSWHMKLRSKAIKLEFLAVDRDTGKKWTIDQTAYLTKRQRKKMKPKPDMIIQFVHYMDKVYKKEGKDNVAIYANVYGRLNDRKNQRLVNQNIDLTKRELHEIHRTWVVPLYSR